MTNRERERDRERESAPAEDSVAAPPPEQPESNEEPNEQQDEVEAGIGNAEQGVPDPDMYAEGSAVFRFDEEAGDYVRDTEGKPSIGELIFNRDPESYAVGGWNASLQHPSEILGIDPNAQTDPTLLATARAAHSPTVDLAFTPYTQEAEAQG